MSFPTRLLDNDEELLIDQVPHWSTIARSVFASVVLVAGIVVVFVVWSTAPTSVGAALGAIALTDGIYLAAKILAWRSKSFVVTSTRVIIRRGLLRRSGREVSLDSIGDVAYHQSLLDRILGRGDLSFGWSGERDDEVVRAIRSPERTQREINRAAFSLREQRARARFDSGTRGERDDSLSLGQLEELHRRGVITAAELAEKRTELLDRS